MTSEPTPRQMATAKQLIRRIATSRARVEHLMRLRDAAQAHVNARDHRLREATNFLMHPHLLAGALPLYRQGGAATRKAVLDRYMRLLHDILVGDDVLRTKPLKLDYAALPLEARPFLVAAWLHQPVNGVYPRLDLDQSALPRSFVLLATAGRLDHAAYRQALPAVADWLGGAWEITDTAKANAITFTRRVPLPVQIPFHPGMLKPNHLLLGINVATRQPHYARLTDLSHMLITGTVGMGKSVGLASIMLSLLNSPVVERIYAVDPGAIAFGRYRSAALTTLAKPDALHALAADLVRLMDRREEELGQKGLEKFTSRLICLVVDEWPAYGTADGTDKESKAAHATFIKHMLALAKRGRKSGLRIVLTTQVPSEQDILPALRAALPSTLAFRTPLQAHASQLFGELAELPADPRTLPRGRALFRDGTTGDMALVQFPLITQPDATP